MDCHHTQQHPDMDFPANIPVFGLAGCRYSVWPDAGYLVYLR